MKTQFYIFIILFFGIFSLIHAQEERIALPKKMYSDRVIDDSGTPLSGLTVRIKGKRLKTTTNANGEFTINAENGDIIELSKNGNVIDTYRYSEFNDHYEVQDKSGVLSDKSKGTEAAEKKKVWSSVSKVKGRNNRAEFEGYLNLAIQFKKSNPTKSIDQIRDALLIANGNNDKSQLAASYNVLGDVYMNLKQYDLAASNYKVSIDNDEDTTVQLKLANAYLLNNEYQKSEKYYKEILQKRGVSDTQKGLANEGLGDVYLKQQKNSNAILQYQKALKIANKQNNTTQITDLNTKISVAFEA